MSPNKETRVSQTIIYAYSLLAFTGTMVAAPITYTVPQLYAKELGVSLAGIGAVVFITRVLNAVSDQVLGYLSDRTVTRYGPRKPWIVGGTIMMLVAAYFLLHPKVGVGLIYFLIWKVIFDLAWTAKTLSYTAWGAELSADYNTRTKISGLRGLFGQFGNISNDFIPIVLASVGMIASSAYSMHLMRTLFIIGAVLIPLFSIISLTVAPAGRVTEIERPTIIGLVKSIRGNRPFWFYLIGFSILGVAQGAIALIFTFYDGYLKVGSWFPYIMTAFSVALALSIAPWTWLSKHIGKHRVFSLAALLNAAALQVFWLINPAVTPHNTVVIVTAVITVINGVATACYVIVPSAILADVIDYGEWKTGAPRAGSYFGFYLLTTQVAGAVGAGLGFMALAAFGYSAKAGAVNSSSAILGLIVTIVGAPGVLCTLSSLIMWRFPLDARRQAILRRRLDERDRRRQDAGLAEAVLIGGPRPAGSAA